MDIDLYGASAIHWMMLDSKESVGSIDARGMLAAVSALPKQLAEGMRLGMRSKLQEFCPEHVIVCGVGGSAIGGDLLCEWLSSSSSVSCEVQRSYALPAHIGKDSLVIVASYSGNTEETLSMLGDARKRHAEIVAVTSGGRLLEVASSGRVPYIRIPKGVQPRASLGYMFGAMAGVLDRCGVVTAKRQAAETIRVLQKVADSCGPHIPTARNEAKRLAHRVFPSIPIVVGHGLTAPVAKRWANQFNENSKILSFSASLPEFDHNEIVGWMRDPRTRLFSSILLEHGADRRMQKRIAATRDMLTRVASVCEVRSLGVSPMTKMFSLVMIGDFVSTYLGILRNEDPSTNEPIDELKAKLAKK